MALHVITLLTLFGVFNSVSQKIPSTSYMKVIEFFFAKFEIYCQAIDVWAMGCIMVVFVALVEYCAVLYVSKIEERLPIPRRILRIFGEEIEEEKVEKDGESANMYNSKVWKFLPPFSKYFFLTIKHEAFSFLK